MNDHNKVLSVNYQITLINLKFPSFTLLNFISRVKITTKSLERGLDCKTGSSLNMDVKDKSDCRRYQNPVVVGLNP